MTTTLRLGDILVNNRVLTAPERDVWLSRAIGRLGEALLAHGLVSGRDLARALATQHEIMTVDISRSPPDAALFSPRDITHYQTHRFIPYRLESGKLTLATPDPSSALRRFVETHYAQATAFVVITERDLRHYLASRGANAVTRQAKLGLRKRFRHLVADRVLLPHQSIGIALLLTLLATLLIVVPTGAWSALILACNLFYLTTLLVKTEFYRQGILTRARLRREYVLFSQDIATMEDAALPTYTILVPLYHESSEVLSRLIQNLSALDYPREKLTIKLICEEDDPATVAALKSLAPPPMMEILVVPSSRPRTKPKACNVAFQQVHSEFVVIYDAEDAPARDQLKRAVAAFRRAGPRVACMQASLNYYNREENLLSRLFAIEYSALFTLLLPGLMRAGVPIPLGGTSNHLRTFVLRKVGGWDAYNVTEDADLGIRLQYFGYETRVLPSRTLEESPITLRAWIKQRTRWIKGYIQTWLVFTRDASELKRRLGSRGYYGFQFFVGAPALTFLVAPAFWAVFILSLVGWLPVAIPLWLQWLCIVSFLAGMHSHWWAARYVVTTEGWQRMDLAQILFPFYWLLHSVAAALALWQLFASPHYWAKTRHGVSKMVA